MKRIIIPVLLLSLASCSSNSGSDGPVSDTTMTMAPELKTDTAAVNTGAWSVTMQPAKNSKGGKLIVSGKISISKPGVNVKLSKQGPSTPSQPGQMYLQLSHEPAANSDAKTNVVYVEDVSDRTKYNQVIVMFKDRRIAVLDIDQEK